MRKKNLELEGDKCLNNQLKLSAIVGIPDSKKLPNHYRLNAVDILILIQKYCNISMFDTFKEIKNTCLRYLRYICLILTALAKQIPPYSKFNINEDHSDPVVK